MLEAPKLDELVHDVASLVFGDGQFHRRELMLAARDRLVELGSWGPHDDVPSRSVDKKPLGLANIDYAISRLGERSLLNRLSHDVWCVGLGQNAEDMDESTRRAVIRARVGQGQFRAAVLDVWQRRCCVTGFAITALLRASHIKPWRVATNAERLDPYNGLLLSPAYDAAFDAGLITFDAGGNIVLAQAFTPDLAQLIGISSADRIHGLTSRHATYLARHREESFGRS